MDLVKNERYSDRNFYKTLTEIKSRKHLMNQEENRLLERSIRNCKLNGLHFDDANHKVCMELRNKISEQQSYFRQRLVHANKKFAFRIPSAMPLDDIPNRIKQMISVDRANPNKGPWSLIPNDEVFGAFMKYSNNRNLRKTYYDGFYSRASYVKEEYQTNNSEIIKEILKYRKLQAKLYNYENYAQLVIEDKAAVSVENVIDMLEKLKTNLKPQLDEDLRQLQKFSFNEGNLIPLENFDLEFWITKHTKHHYGIDQSQVMQYFPMQKVLNGLFDASKMLFNVEFKKNESYNEKLLDKNILAYDVHDETGEHISTLMIDPYLRSNKINSIWSYSGRESSLIAGYKPLANLVLNARNTGPSTLLTFEQVEQIFTEFGNCLQILLAKTNYTDFSDINSVEIDAYGLTKKLFKHLIYVPQIMDLCSAHVNTGEPLPKDILERLKKGNSNFKLFELMRQAYLSAFDIECHITEKFWSDICDELWPKFLPLKKAENDYRPCQFMSVFAENFGCLYYSHIWSDMLTTDIFDAFNDIGFENKNQIQEVGRKYRDTFLKHGSSMDSNELFRQFRGRNPSLDPLIKLKNPLSFK